MQQVCTQPAGPKAFRLYATVRDTYRQDLGKRTFAVYEALTYYVDPKTLQGAIPLKLLAQTIPSHPSTVSRHLHKLEQLGLITITPQWDAFECVRDVNVYSLDAWPLKALPLRRPRLAAATVPKRRQAGQRCTVLHFPGPTHTTPNRPKMPAQL
jgi:DNA-binding transcriptional ArsR family regulator